MTPRKNSKVACFYSRTTRRYRGSSKEKAQRLQERLWQAEQLLKTAGIVDPHHASTHSIQGLRTEDTPAAHPVLHNDHSSLQPVSHQILSVDVAAFLGQAQNNIDAVPPALPGIGSSLHQDPSHAELTGQEELIPLNLIETKNLSSDHAGAYGRQQKPVIDPR